MLRRARPLASVWARRFEPAAPLGPGVVRAVDLLSGATRIVKTARAAEEQLALGQELRALRALEGHPAGRRVFASWEHDGAHVVALEDVTGTALDRAVPQDAQSARRLTVGLLRAVLALHARGWVHGDLKPAHVLVDATQSGVRLLDLGLATRLGESARGGTAGFLAPELLAGAECSAATELHAVGRTLLACPWVRMDGAVLALAEACAAAQPEARPASLEAALARLDALPRGLDRGAKTGSALETTLDAVERALETAHGQLVVVESPRRGGRTHFAAALVARELARRASTTRFVVDARPLLAGLVALGPLVGAGPTEDRERLVERTVQRAVEDGLVLVLDGADDASPDLRADLVLAARALRALERGALVVLGADAPLLEALNDARGEVVRVALPAMDADALAQALEARGVELAPAERAELLATTRGAPGHVHDVLRALEDEPELALALTATARALDAPPRDTLGPAGATPSERTAARRAYEADAPRAVLDALGSDDDRDDTTRRWAAWAHARLGRFDRALVLAGAIVRPTAEDHARHARWLERTGALERAYTLALGVAAEDPAEGPGTASDAWWLARVVAATSAYGRGRLDDVAVLVGSTEAPLASRTSPVARASWVRLRNVASDLALARGDRALARRAALEARDAAAGDASLVALAESRLGAIAGLGGQAADARRHYAAALAAAESAGDVSALPPYLTNVATAAHALGDVDEALATYERAAALAERLGRDVSLATSLVNLAALHLVLRAEEEAATLVDRAASIATRAGADLVLAQAHLVRAELAAERGSLELARRECTAAREVFEARGAERQALEARILALEIELASPDASTASLEGALVGLALPALERPALDRQVDPDALDATLEGAGLGARAALVRAELALRRGRPSEASVHAETARQRARDARQPDQVLRALAFLARLHVELGTGAAASHIASFRERLGELAARTPATLRERLLQRWTARLPALPTFPSEPLRGVEAGLGAIGARLVSLVRRTLLEADEARLLEAALDEAIAATLAERGFLLLARGAHRASPRGAPRAEVAVARNLDRDTIKQPRFRLSRSVADRVLATDEPLVTASASEDPSLAGSRSILDLGLRSIVCVPVRSPSGVVGALYLDHRFERGRFDASVATVAQAFADVIGLALENRRLHHASESRLREAEALRAAAEERAEAHLVEADRMAALLAARDTASHDAPGGIVGSSEPLRAAIALARKVARSDLSVAIEGESGTGKELFARLVHDASPRHAGPFLAIHCGAMPEPLLESELFGHVRGAFTGATRDHAGLLRSASGGTVFLDEVGEMPPAMQVRLLRALQEREVRPVGGRSALPIDVRIVAATHRTLTAEVEAGRFRQDLYFRLAGVTLKLPALRDRPGDIPLVAQAILASLGPPTRRLSRRALAALLAHPFPGNVRELEQALRRAVVVAESDTLEPDDLDLPSPSTRAPSPPSRPTAAKRSPSVDGPLSPARVARALDDADGNRSRAAAALGVSRATLHRFLAAHPPERPARRGRPRH